MKPDELDRKLSRLKVFWTALSLIGVSTRQRDVLDAAAFVTALGPAATRGFVAEVKEFHECVAQSALGAILADGVPTAGTVDTDLVVRSAEAMATSGRGYFSLLLREPDRVETDRHLEVGLLDALALIRAAPHLVDGRQFSGRMRPLRRDGSPWIALSMGLDLGVRMNDWPFNSDDFIARIDKWPAVCSQMARWQDLRRERGIRSLDVVLEYTKSDAKPAECEVVRRGPVRVEVSVRRGVPSREGGVSDEALADQEIHAIMDQVFEALREPVGATLRP